MTRCPHRKRGRQRADYTMSCASSVSIVETHQTFRLAPHEATTQHWLLRYYCEGLQDALSTGSRLAKVEKSGKGALPAWKDLDRQPRCNDLDLELRQTRRIEGIIASHEPRDGLGSSPPILPWGLKSRRDAIDHPPSITGTRGSFPLPKRDADAADSLLAHI